MVRQAGKDGLGKRPHVRGVAMNPVDHPLGGGEGKGFRRKAGVHPMGQARGNQNSDRTREPTDI